MGEWGIRILKELSGGVLEREKLYGGGEVEGVKKGERKSGKIAR